MDSFLSIFAYFGWMMIGVVIGIKLDKTKL